MNHRGMTALFLALVTTSALGGSDTPSSVRACSASSCSNLGWGNAAFHGDERVCSAASATGGVLPRAHADCSGDLPWPEAVRFCESIGARLCSKEETLAGNAAGLGCEAEKKRIWTSTTCGPDKFIAAGPGSKALHVDPICLETGIGNAVRCCADVEACLPAVGTAAEVVDQGSDSATKVVEDQTKSDLKVALYASEDNTTVSEEENSSEANSTIESPTLHPASLPIASPTLLPISAPSKVPSIAAVKELSKAPPTIAPVQLPTLSPSVLSAPSLKPLKTPTPTVPTFESSAPSLSPFKSPAPSLAPLKTSAPTVPPVKSAAPTVPAPKSPATTTQPTSSPTIHYPQTSLTVDFPADGMEVSGYLVVSWTVKGSPRTLASCHCFDVLLYQAESADLYPGQYTGQPIALGYHGAPTADNEHQVEYMLSGNVPKNVTAGSGYSILVTCNADVFDYSPQFSIVVPRVTSAPSVAPAMANTDDRPSTTNMDDKTDTDNGSYADGDGSYEGNHHIDTGAGDEVGTETNDPTGDDNGGKYVFDDEYDGAVSTSQFSLWSLLRPALYALVLSLAGAMLYLLHQCFCAETLIPNDPNFSSGPKPGRETELARFDRMSTMSCAYKAEKPLYARVDEGRLEDSEGGNASWMESSRASYEKVDQEFAGGWDGEMSDGEYDLG